VHTARALMLSLVCLGALSASCKQKSKEDLGPEPAPTTSAATASPQAVAPPPDTIPPPTPPPSAVVPAAKPADKTADVAAIKACCAALHKEEANVAPKDKGTYESAANSCDQISKLVAAGTTSHASALTAVRAAVKGGKLPPSCH